MNKMMTEAEIGEAMRRLAAMEGHKPTAFGFPPTTRVSNPHVARRREMARGFHAQGLRYSDILGKLAEAGIPTTLSTLKHDLTMAE